MEELVTEKDAGLVVGRDDWENTEVNVDDTEDDDTSVPDSVTDGEGLGDDDPEGVTNRVVANGDAETVSDTHDDPDTEVQPDTLAVREGLFDTDAHPDDEREPEIDGVPLDE